MITLPEFVLFDFSEQEKKSFSAYLKWKSTYWEYSFQGSFLHKEDIRELNLSPKIALYSKSFIRDEKWVEEAKRKGVFLFYPLNFFMENFSFSFFKKSVYRESVFLLENRPSVYLNLKSVLGLFSIGVENEILKEPFSLSSWTEITNIERILSSSQNLHPVMFLNLDLPNLDLTSFLSSFKKTALDKSRHRYLQPYLIPVKDFSRANLYNNLLSGLRKFSRSIFTDEERMQNVVMLLLQNRCAKIFANAEKFNKTVLSNKHYSFSQSCKEHFIKGNFDFSPEEFLERQYLLTGKSEEIKKVSFFYKGLSFWFENFDKNTKKGSESLHHYKIKRELSEVKKYIKII